MYSFKESYNRRISAINLSRIQREAKEKNIYINQKAIYAYSHGWLFL